MTTWTFGGTALTTYGKVISIDDYLDIADARGENIVIPYRHGSTFVRKYYGERSLVFRLAITAATAGALETVLDNLRAKIAVRTQQTLAMTMEDATVRNVSASVDRPLQVDRRTNTLAFVEIEFTLCEPFFRLSTAIADNSITVDANPKAWTVTNPGSIEERDPTIILTGPLQNTVITNSSNGCVLTYSGTIASPRVVTIKTLNGEFVATDDLGNNLIGNVTHSGASALMVFDIGANTMSIADATHTTGIVKSTFNAPFA